MIPMEWVYGLLVSGDCLLGANPLSGTVLSMGVQHVTTASSNVPPICSKSTCSIVCALDSLMDFGFRWIWQAGFEWDFGLTTRFRGWLT
jgi:hypothetical protein